MAEKDYLGKLPYRTCHKALTLINNEYRHAVAGKSEKGKPPKKPLGPCDDDCCVSTQYGIACRHIILERIQTAKKEKHRQLKLSDVHHHWHMARVLVSCIDRASPDLITDCHLFPGR